MKRLEDFIQYKCAEALRRIGQPFFHVPNASKRGAREGARLKAMGMVAGVHDIWLLFERNHVEPVELKTDEGTLLDSQERFHDTLFKMEFRGHVIQTDCPEEAVRQLLQIVEAGRARAQNRS